MPTKEKMLAKIIEYVKADRIKSNISEDKLGTGPKSRQEISCSGGGGEFAHMVDGQLVSTIFGYGYWKAWEVDVNLLGCYEYVIYRKSGYKGED